MASNRWCLHRVVNDGFLTRPIKWYKTFNLQDRDGNTPLHYCCIFGIGPLFLRVLKYTDVNIKNNKGETVLSYFTDEGQLSILNYKHERHRRDRSKRESRARIQ